MTTHLRFSIMMLVLFASASNARAEDFLTTFQVGVLGDSISRGYDINQLRTESPELVWASGTDLPNSHYNRFRALMPNTTITVNNVALVGDTVTESNSEFQARATQLANWGADYVAILIGANDICAGDLATPAGVQAFQDGVATALKTLLTSAHPPKAVTVASIPHIWALTQIPEFQSNGFCSMVWNMACPNLKIGQADFDAQWAAANRALEAAAAAAGHQVVFDQMGVASYNFTVNEVSQLDCFHPSQLGQGVLADVVWNHVAAQVQPLLAPQEK